MNNLDFWQENEKEFELKLFLLKYLRYWYWFALTLFLAFSIAYVYLKLKTPIFKITASLLIKDEMKGTNGGNEVLKELDMFTGSKLVENEIEVLKSKFLAEKVIDDLNLSVSYYNSGIFRDRELYHNKPVTVNYVFLQKKAYEKPIYIKPIDSQNFELLDYDKKLVGKYIYSQNINIAGYGRFRVFLNKSKLKNTELTKIKFSRKENLIQSLANRIQIELINPNSTVLQLSIEEAVPEKGKAILAKLIDAYAFSSLEDKNGEATNTLRFIGERLKLITSDLTNVEKDVEQYKSSEGITDLSAEGNLFLEKVKENDSKLSEVDIQLKVLEGVERYLSSGQNNVAPASLMVQDPILTSYIANLGELELQKEKTARTVQAGNPFLETINNQIANTKQAIRENVSNQKKGLLIAKSGLAGNNNRFVSAIRTIPRKEREFINIKRQQNIIENIYLMLLQKREETALSYASAVTDSRIVDKPNSTSGPVKPVSRNIYLLALLIGIIIPSGIIHIKELLNDRVQTKKEIEAITGVSIFGELGLKPEEETDSLIDLKSRSLLAEQFRMLRTNLQYVGKPANGEGKVLLFTSSTSGEGKSFVSVNLAASLAALGKKVVLIELDLRKPKISNYIGVSRDKGISNYLIGDLTERDIVKSTKVENLSLVSCGPIPPNPSELLSNGRIEILIQAYRKDFDYILIDSPPIGLVTDTLILNPFVDVCFYIVRHEVSLKQNLNLLADLKKAEKLKSLSVIFNGINYENSEEYRYGSGYGYGYYTENEKPDFFRGQFRKTKKIKNKLVHLLNNKEKA